MLSQRREKLKITFKTDKAKTWRASRLARSRYWLRIGDFNKGFFSSQWWIKRKRKIFRYEEIESWSASRAEEDGWCRQHNSLRERAQEGGETNKKGGGWLRPEELLSEKWLDRFTLHAMRQGFLCPTEIGVWPIIFHHRCRIPFHSFNYYIK